MEAVWCRRGDSNPHGVTRRILSALRLPFRHSGGTWDQRPGEIVPQPAPLAHGRAIEGPCYPSGRLPRRVSLDADGVCDGGGGADHDRAGDKPARCVRWSSRTPERPSRRA